MVATLMPLYGLDIETANTAPRIDPEIPSALDPRVGSITTIAIAGPESCFVLDDRNEGHLLNQALRFLAKQESGIIVTWNGQFDLVWVMDRAARHRIDPDIQAVPDPAIHLKYGPQPGHSTGYRFQVGRHRHVDVAPLYRHLADDGVTWRLKPVCKHLGIPMVEENAAELEKISAAQRSAYCLSDAIGTRELAARHPNLLAYVDCVVSAAALPVAV